MPGPYTPANAGEGLIRFRVRNANTPGAQADTEIVSPYSGRIVRVLAAFEGDPTANWVANLVTPYGTVVGAIDLSAVGHANVGQNDCVEFAIPADQAAYVNVGDRVQIATTAGDGTATSIYGWLVIQ